MLFGRHYNREGAVMRGRGTLQECRRITARALSCKVRDTEGFEEIVAEPSTSRMATGWDIVWCDGRKMGADATDHPELCDVAARLHDVANDSIEQLVAAAVRAPSPERKDPSSCHRKPQAG